MVAVKDDGVVLADEEGQYEVPSDAYFARVADHRWERRRHKQSLNLRAVNLCEH